MSPPMMAARRLPFATVLLVCVLVPRTGQAQAAAAPAAPPTLDLAQWEADIRAFEEADRQIPPPRDGVLLAGTVNPRSRHAEARQIFVITHVDIDPQFVPPPNDVANPVLDTFVSDSLSDPGVQTFALISQAGTANHFQLIEVLANRQAFNAHVSAQHTLDFRNDIQPFIGAPYDERLYHFADR